MTSKKNNAPPQILYSELAPWFHLVTAPEEYKDEASFYMKTLEQSSSIPVKTVLEMGSGGGNNAFYMKSKYSMTLTDLSEDILRESKKINPECEHVKGDMRSLKLGRKFDAVFVHDAIDYMLTEDDLLNVFKTAFLHCKPGGAALFCPDYTRETFSEGTETGGHDSGGRGLRYLDWAWDADEKGESWVSHFIFIMKDGDKVMYRTDEHRCGLFSKQTWLDLMAEAGFKNVKAIPHPEVDNWPTPVFAGVKPKD